MLKRFGHRARRFLREETASGTTGSGIRIGMWAVIGIGLIAAVAGSVVYAMLHHANTCGSAANTITTADIQSNTLSGVAC